MPEAGRFDSPHLHSEKPATAGFSFGVPFAYGFDRFPFHLDALSVAGILQNHTDGLDAHHGDRVAARIEADIFLPCLGSLDGYALTWPHGLYMVDVLVII